MSAPNRLKLADLAEYLRRWDIADLLASVGALQLVPANADKWVRLSMLAAACCGIGEGSNRRISRSQFQKLVNGLVPSTWVDSEDPPDGLFTSTIPGPGGSHTVIVGPLQEAVAEVSVMYEALFMDEIGLNAEFVLEAKYLVQVIEVLCIYVAEKAGLKRGTRASATNDGKLDIPGRGGLEALKAAVNLEASLAKFLDDAFESAPFLREYLLISAPRPIGTDIEVALNTLGASPIVRVRDQYIIAQPSGLVTAATRGVLNLAIAHGEQAAVAAAIHATATKNLQNVFKRWGWEQESQEAVPVAEKGALATSTIFRLAGDLLAKVVLFSDPLESQSGYWLFRPAELSLQLTKNERNLGFDVGLKVIALQSFGNQPTVLFTTSEGDRFVPMFSVADLNTIQHVERNNPVALIQFCRHASKKRERTAVMAFNLFDEYAFYERNGHSYYASDAAAPNFMTIQTGYGAALRARVLPLVDYHGVRVPTNQSIVAVERMHNSESIPIYSNYGIRGVLLELPSLGLWVTWEKTATELASPIAYDIHYLKRMLAEAIAYWLMSFAPALTGVFDGFGEILLSLEFRIVLNDEISWAEAVRAARPSSIVEGSITTSSEPATGLVIIRIDSTCWPAFFSKQNEAERNLMIQVLRGIRDLMPTRYRWLLSEEKIESVISEFAPVSAKKMVILVDASVNPELMPTVAPPFRPLQKAEQELLLDDLGAYLIDDIKLPFGELDGERAGMIIRDYVVPYLFLRLEDEIARLSPVGLLEWLVSQHESNLQELALGRLLTVPRLRCYGEEVASEVQSDMTQKSDSDLATRFLIEYASTIPPKGTRPIGILVFDRILAICYELIRYGMDCDLLHYRLATTRFGILESRRLGQDREDLTRQQRTFFGRVFAGELRTADTLFAAYWRKIENAPTFDDEIIRLDAAVAAEFGFTVTQVRDGLIWLTSKAFETEAPFVCVKFDDLAEEMSMALEWDVGFVRFFVEEITLSPRSKFLEPDPARYHSRDTWPWRFNRRLSYLRKPLLRRESGDTSEILWSGRSVFRAGSYFLDLLLGGRLPPSRTQQTSEMSSLQGTLNNSRGREFEDRVKAPFASESRFEVKTRVVRLGAACVGEVGDIDAVILDRERRRIFVCECKNLLLAKTPYDMAQQVESIESDNPIRKTASSQALKKTAWVADRVPDALAMVGIDVAQAPEWTCHPLVVLDSEIFVALVRTFTVPITSFHRLWEVLTAQ